MYAKSYCYHQYKYAHFVYTCQLGPVFSNSTCIIFLIYIISLIGDNGRLQYLRFCLSEMYLSVGFLSCLYSAVSLTLVREHFVRIIFYYYNTLRLVACIETGGTEIIGETNIQQSFELLLWP